MPIESIRRAHIVGALVAVGIMLRLVLYVSNRPDNAYDDHWAPIETMLEQGRLPKVEDCWECGQPPLFYVLGLAVFRACRTVIEVPEDLYSMRMLKAIQSISFIFGALTVVVGGLTILSLFRNARALLAGVGLLALFPRHVYLSAMLANDALATFLTTLTVFVAVRPPRDTWPSRRKVALVAFIAGLAALAKGTALALIPAMGVWIVCWSIRARSVKLFVTYGAIAMLSFLLGGGWLYVWRGVEYGDPFVKNMELAEFQFEQEEAYEGFASFLPRPFKLMRVPLVDDATVSSLPTQLYARMWFDYEPYLAGNASGVVSWARVAYLLGIIPSILIALGFYLMGRRASSDPTWAMVLIFFLSNLGLVVSHTIAYRVYSAMKATYLMPSLVALGLALALSLQEKVSQLSYSWRRAVDTVLVLAGGCFAAQIIWIVLSGPGHHGL